MAVAGDSAGGDLAAVVAQVLPADGTRLTGQCLIHPAVDARGEHPSRVDKARGYLLEQPTVFWFYGHYAGAFGDAKDPRLSPLHAADLSGLPPAVVVTAEFDPLHDEDEAYGEALRAAGVQAEVTRYDGLVHGFDMGTASPAAQAAIDESSARWGAAAPLTGRPGPGPREPGPDHALTRGAAAAPSGRGSGRSTTAPPPGRRG